MGSPFFPIATSPAHRRHIAHDVGELWCREGSYSCFHEHCRRRFDFSGCWLHCVVLPHVWTCGSRFDTFDHQALRRGFQVYQEVCASCHSLSRIPYRTLVGTVLTVDEAKALAEANEYEGEPDEQGETTMRPGKLADYIPSPYKNEEAARFANNGALPPDLSLIVKARHGGCNYIFDLLTGYPEEPPAGAVVAPGMNFNPYFPGTGIAMARVLY